MKRKNLLFLLLALIFAPWAANAQETLTVCDGSVEGTTTTTSNYVPIYGLYVDTQGQNSEFIIPAETQGMSDMEGGTISKLAFYITNSPDTWGSPTVQVYMGEVEGTTLSSLNGPTNFTTVWTGTLSNQSATMEITLSEPYTYEGGNLLIGMYVQTKSTTYNTTSFSGISAPSGSSRYNSGSGSGSAVSFLPKTTFTYEPAQSGGDVCEKPATLVAENVTGNSATLTWTGGSGVYNIELNGTIIEENYEGYTYSLRDLTATTAYTAKVQSVCDGTTPTSGWKSVSFTTPCASYDIPYTYDFEAEAPFACWTPITGVTRANSTSNAHNSSYYLRFASTTSNLVALPQFNEPTNNLRVEFWTRPESATNSSCGTFSVGYMTDITDASTFVEVANYAYNDWSTATYEKKTVDFVNAPANANIAFRHNAGSSSWYWFADDVTVKEIPSCLAPTGLAATASTTSAELSWTANSGETAWTLYWKKTTDENYTEVANATNPYTLQGLDAASNYEFYVVANCSADDASEASEPFTFATACDVIPALGYSENFDSYTAGNNVLPTCWSYINTTTNSTYAVYPRVYANSSYSTYANSAPNCLYLYSYGSSDPQPQYAILPEMTGLAGLQVTLMAKGYNSSSTLKIGTMSDPTDANTFTMIAEQTLTTSYPDDPFEFIIPADCRDSYLAIMIDAAPSGYNTRGVYVDDIVIREAPTCIKPTELALTGVSTTTATIGWTNGADDQTAWQICLNGDEENLIMAESNPFTIEDLTAATSYTVKVRAYCGEDSQSDWSNEVNFATLCEAISTFPWTENFNSLTAGIPTCWDNSEGTTTALNYMWNYYASGHEGAGLRFNSYNNSNGLTNFLKTVSLSLPSDQLMQLSFWYKNPTGGDFSVYISTDGGATHETALATGLTGVTTWTELVISLADYAGQEVVIVFKGTSNYGNGDAYIYLDDVTVMEVPTCMKPTDLEVTTTTTTTATLSWTAGADETAWQICLNGDETNLIPANSNPFTVEGLTASTAYTAKVRAYCNADDQSEWSTEISFATDCDILVVDATHPLFENFDGITSGIPVCWDNSEGTTTNESYKWNYYAAGYKDHCVRFDSYNNSEGNTNFLKTPVMDLPSEGENLQLSFWYKNPTGGDFSVFISTDGGETYTTALASDLTDQTDWTNEVISLSEYAGNENVVIVFAGTSNWAYGDAYIYLDEVYVGMPFTKTIIGYANSTNPNGGYYLIASPVVGEVTPTAENGFITDDFDLYYFDDSSESEWINWKDQNSDQYHFNIENGRGYLYASSTTTTLTFTGTPNTNGEVTLQKNENLNWSGWNLVGNPLAQTAYLPAGRDFYTMDDTGANIVAINPDQNSIEAMEGIFVLAEENGETITFSTTAPENDGKGVVINLLQGRGVIDRAIVRFGEGRTLPKFQLWNSTKVYIPMDDQKYAVVRSEEVGEMPVSFKAEENGTYTLSFSALNTEFGYLHLVDNMTDTDVDLLATPSYTFEANVTDYANRFKLVFATGNTGDDNFAFFSNGSFVINNEGNATLQVIDVTGRILSAENINGCASVNFDAAAGVYMLRLVNGENVKVQKVVVR